MTLKVAVGLVGGVAAAVVTQRTLQRIGQRRQGTLTGRLLHDRLGPPAAVLAFVAVAWAVLARRPGGPIIDASAFVLLVVAAAMLVDRLTTEAATWHLHRIASRADGSTLLRTGVTPLVRQVSRAIVIFLAAIMLLSHFHVNVTAFITTAGVASLALGLAAQDTLSNLFAGITILFDRPFRPGDRVEIGTLVGDVVEVGLRSTHIRDFNNNIVVIPNQQIVATQVTNRAYPNDMVAVQVNVGVGYDTDVDEATRIMLDVAHACPDVLPNPAPAVYFSAFGESSLQMQMWAYVGDYRRLFTTLDALNRGVLERFRTEGIEIPFPQQVVTLRRR